MKLQISMSTPTETTTTTTTNLIILQGNAYQNFINTIKSQVTLANYEYSIKNAWNI